MSISKASDTDSFLKPAFTQIPNVKAIYVVSDFSTGKAYVGATNNMKLRHRDIKNHLTLGKHHNFQFQKAFDEKHDLRMLFIPVEDKVDPFVLEKQLIEELKPQNVLYNVVAGAGERKHSDESKKQMRSAKLGKVTSAETKTKISLSTVGKNLRIKRTPEQCNRYHECRLEQAKPVVVDGVEYESVLAASKAYNTNPGTASSRIRSTTKRFSNWNYKKEI